MDIATLLSIATALGVGGILGGLFERGTERRAARAKVLEALGKLEEQRWAPDNDEVRVRSREFLVAAMVARIPVDLARTYAHLALASGYLSRADWEQTGPNGQGAGAIDGELAEITTDAAQLVVLAAWRPWYSFRRRRGELGRIVRKRAKIQNDQIQAGDPQDTARWLQIAKRHIV